MSGVAFFYVGCGIGIALGGFGWLMKFDPSRWIAEGLKRGDLYSLIDVASGLRPDGLTQSQAERLQARGMVHCNGNGHYRATLKGRLALLIRTVVRSR